MEETEYRLAAPRRVQRARRGPGVVEYQVRLIPAPPAEVRETYNATKPSDARHPRLKPSGFVILCPEDDIERRLDYIRTHSLLRLAEITIDLRDE
jgi:hypothetical protein